MGTLFHTFTAKEWGGYGEISSHSNLHLRIDFVLLLIMGVMLYAFPPWSFKIAVGTKKLQKQNNI